VGADVTLRAGCAPCQTFSTYNQKAKPTDRRWWLLDEFSRLIREVSPDIVTMENVPGLVKQKIFDQFVDELKCNDYNVNYRVVNCEEYGVPQHRQRLVLLASRLGPVRLLSPEKFDAPRQNVRDAIGHLPPISAGEVHPDDPLHRSSALSELNLRRIRSSRPGGTWRDWDSDLIAECHKKDTGRTYPGVYGRMSWDEPAPTMTTQFYGFGNGRFGHPEQDRAISLREGAILQSFPPDYVFVPPDEEIYVKTVGRLVGNAVPVTLGKVIGESILEHLSVCRILQNFRREKAEYA
jgi:DNA (cytosine-5)-methyltransferase 1